MILLYSYVLTGILFSSFVRMALIHVNMYAGQAPTLSYTLLFKHLPQTLLLSYALFLGLANPKHMQPCTRAQEAHSELRNLVKFLDQTKPRTPAEIVLYTFPQLLSSTCPIYFIRSSSELTEVLNSIPIEGPTPLYNTLLNLRDRNHIRRGDTLCIISDGEPTDCTAEELGQLINEFLTQYHVVLRMITDDTRVVQFYNELETFIDAGSDYSFSVLDDYASESREVHQHNGWKISYTSPLHTIRMFPSLFDSGVRDLFDKMDERPLNSCELNLLYDKVPSCIWRYGWYTQWAILLLLMMCVCTYHIQKDMVVHVRNAIDTRSTEHDTHMLTEL